MSRFLPGKLTISSPSGVDWDSYSSIRIQDTLSGNEIIEIKITKENLMKALQGQGHVSMEFIPRGLKNVGKKCVREDMEFPLGPRDLLVGDRKAAASQKALKILEGTEWTPSTYFGSKNSFFERDGFLWARTEKYKYVEPTEEEYNESFRKSYF